MTSTVSLHASDANQKKSLKYHASANSTPSQCAAVESVRLKKTISVRNYHTREVLRCPFHRLAYQIEYDEKVKTSNQLVHCELHGGHSHLLEASNVLLRF